MNRKKTVFIIALSLFVVVVIVTMITERTTREFVVDRTLFPFESRFVTLASGARIHYVDEGQGPLLLLLHGNPTWSFLYRDIIAELKDSYRLIAPDYPGFGLSSSPEGYGFTAAEQAAIMAAFIEKLDLTDITVFMQDWGGPIGFFVAERHPERVSGFVIGNTWAWPIERKGQMVFSTVMGGWPGQLAAWCCDGVVRFFLSRGVATKISDAELAMYLGPFAAPGTHLPTHIFPAELTDAKAFLTTVRNGLKRLSDRPALIVWGLEDFAFQKPERERFETLFPQHQTVLLKNAGHFIQEDAPVKIASAIRDWLKR